MKRLSVILLCICLLFTACGRKADCPEGAREAIDAYVAERKKMEGMHSCRLYSIEQEHDMLYKFQYKEYLDYRRGSLYEQKYGRFHGLLCTAYTAPDNMGIWQIYSSIDNIEINCPSDARLAIENYLSEKYSKYTLNSVKERSSLLYSFSYTETHLIPLVNPASPENTAASGEDEYEEKIHTDYVYLLEGKWKTTNNFGSIPGHILRGEDGDTALESNSSQEVPEEVLDTFNRWTDNSSADGEGSWETHIELCYWGEDLVPSAPGISMNTVLAWEIRSVTRVNDELYEIISTVTDKYMDEPLTYQHFVGLIDGEWKIMVYQVIPEQLREGLDAFDEYRFTENGIEIIPGKA